MSMQRLLLFLGAMGLILLLSYNGANAQDLVYNPINPSFAGGNYFNGHLVYDLAVRLVHLGVEDRSEVLQPEAL